MNIKKLFKAQKELDANILEKHPLQDGENRTEKKICALLVEIAECANEWRGFKFWSKDQEAKTFEPNPNDMCKECNGQGYLNSDLDLLNPKRIFCENCDGCGAHFYNPLLEEYVDGLHFVLSLGNDIEFNEAPFMTNTDPYIHTEDEDVNAQFLEVFHDVAYYWNNFKNEEDRFEDYEDILRTYLGLGQLLGFTPEEIENAYFEKNQINHNRQESGY